MATATQATTKSRRGTLPATLVQPATAANAPSVSDEQRTAITDAVARIRRIPIIRDPLTIQQLVDGINTFAQGLSHQGFRFKHAVVHEGNVARICFTDPDRHEIHMDFTLETLPAPYTPKKTDS